MGKETWTELTSLYSNESWYPGGIKNLSGISVVDKQHLATICNKYTAFSLQSLYPNYTFLYYWCFFSLRKPIEQHFSRAFNLLKLKNCCNPFYLSLHNSVWILETFCCSFWCFSYKFGNGFLHAALTALSKPAVAEPIFFTITKVDMEIFWLITGIAIFL